MTAEEEKKNTAEHSEERLGFETYFGAFFFFHAGEHFSELT